MVNRKKVERGLNLGYNYARKRVTFMWFAFSPYFVMGLVGSYDVCSNAYNPTQQDIIEGNCSL
jgi:hypothetical protein